MSEAVAQVRAASRQMVRELGVLDSHMGSLDLSCAQGHVLMEIESAGSLTSGELSERLNLDPSTMSRTVGKLLERGFLAVAEGDDRRSKPLILTSSGLAKLNELHGTADRQVSEALGLLRPEDRQAVVQGLQFYAKALRQARQQREFLLRPIEPRDDATMARIIRTVLVAFGVTGTGSAMHDPEVEAMSAAYSAPGTGYFVLERAGRTVGGAGFGPLAGSEDATAEVRKMYLLPEVRGNGMGRRLLATVLEAAKAAGYRRIYLETVPQMTAARALYESFGFQQLDSPLGCTGHTSCDVWYVRDL